MKIALINVSKNKRLSKETPCFEAEILLDGKPAGRVRNDGGGGSNVYEYPQTGILLAKYANRLPPVRLVYKGRKVEIKQSADTVLFDLL